MTVTIKGGNMSLAEQNAYLDMLRKNHPEKIFKEITFTINGDYIDVDYTYDVVPFERIRRITGYLVGNMTRWNNGKRAEEADRVKHSAA